MTDPTPEPDDGQQAPPPNENQFVVTFEADGFVGQGTAPHPPEQNGATS